MLKLEEAVRRAKWQLDYYRKDGIVPIDCATLSALLDGYEAAENDLRSALFDDNSHCRYCMHCQKGECDPGFDCWDDDPKGSNQHDFKWRGPCAENRRKEK